jgi:hypothetical protein
VPVPSNLHALRKEIKLSLCLITPLRHESVEGVDVCIDSSFLDLGTG